MKTSASRAGQTNAATGKRATPPATLSLPQTVFALLCGIWIGLSFLKFGNPIIFDRMVGTPKDWAEFVFTPWPLAWGYAMLVVVIVAAIPVLKAGFDRRAWPVFALGFWLFWQFLSNAGSIDPRLSNPTLVHLVTCGAAFLLGSWALRPLRACGWFWTPILIAFFYVLFSGFDQHAGGLEATRKAFYAQANWQMYPREYLLKIESNRIFSTLVYPNALAGLILLCLPAVLGQSWRLTEKWPRVARGVLCGIFAYLGLACLYWTGSKGGWLIGLIVAGVLALQSNISRQVKSALIVGGLVLGLAAFFVRFSSYFEKGATSVGARFIYWKAAAQITGTHPILGTGPGTFSVLFSKLKPPEAEMAKLVHNDYLEQFCDSGIPGGLAFAAAIFGLLVRRPQPGVALDRLLWLGLIGWALQAFIEFGLYVPAIAWPAFLFLGALHQEPVAEIVNR